MSLLDRIGWLFRTMAPAGTYSCFVREIAWTGGERAGETELLEGGELELGIITDQKLLWQYQDGETVHGGKPLDIVRRANELSAHQPEDGLTIRVALGPEPMRFTAQHSTARFSGICFFKPRVTL